MRIHAVLLFLTLLIAHSEATPRLPQGFEATTVVDKITAATALAIAPDGRVFYAEQTGKIWIVKAGERLSPPALDIGPKLDTWWERGLIGLTLHPDFPRSPYLYTVYVAKEPYTHHVVSRFTVVGDVLDPTSEMILLEGDDQASLGGFQPAGHQGGSIIFGQDGMLYIGLGEQTAGKPSQSLHTLQGKILRLRQDGSIPEDNPFYERTEGKYRAIYALGIRNPFGFAVDPASGRLLEVDVGGSAFEEVNVIASGGNYGWPEAEGHSDDDRFINPIHTYPPAIGRSICGAMIYPHTGTFPEKWRGKLFVADWANHWLRAINLESPQEQIPFAEGFAAPVAIAAAPDGAVYLLNRNTRWRDGKVYQDETGSLVRIRYVGDEGIPPPAPDYPDTLEATGHFRGLTPVTPRHDFHAFALNAPPRQAGVTIRRWLRLPSKGTIETSARDDWQFPQGTVLIHHIDTTDGHPFETHIYTANNDATWQALAYQWDGQATTLIEHSALRKLPGSHDLNWFSPGIQPQLHPSLAMVGFLLQMNARQLHVGDQLASWQERGWIDGVEDWPRLVRLDDSSASLEDRARSYLDVHCAVCHRPGGPSRGAFDARFTTALREQGLLDGPLMAGHLDIPHARVIVSGDPDKSILWQRMRRHDAFRMPPVAVNPVEPTVLTLMHDWITTLQPATVRLTEDAIDGSAGDLPAYKIETPAATYYLEKSGAGLSSVIDRDGNDWLGFHPEPGSGAGGEYRGFPNAVHQQAGNYFHARNAGTDPSATTVTRRDPHHVTITAESSNGLWACRYDFTPQYCTFTMTKMPESYRYWALYEGIPGGDYDDHDWWMTSAVTEKQVLTQPHEGDIPAPEWMAFGDPDQSRALYLYHHEDDAHPDRFYQMHQKMTVFGFGRKGIDKFLDEVPQSISIGLLEVDTHEAISQAIRERHDF